MRITVVGLGKIGLPLAVQFADRATRSSAPTSTPSTVETVNAGTEPFPGEAHLAEQLAEVVGRGALRATTDTTAAPCASSDAVVVVVPLFVDDEARPDFGWMDSATDDIARGLTPGTLVSYETTLPVGTTRTRWKPRLEAGSGLVEGSDFHLVFSPERVLTGRVFADLRKYPKLVGGPVRRRRRAGRGVLRGGARSSTSAPTSSAATASGTSARPRRPRWPSSPRRPTATSTSAWRTSSARSPAQARHRRLPGHRGQQLPALQPHPPARHRRRWALHPGLPAAVPVERPGRHRRAGRSRGQRRRCRRTPSASPSERPEATSPAAASPCSAPPTAVGSRRRRSPGSSPPSTRCGTPGAEVVVHDPMYTAERARRFGWDAYTLGDPADVVVVQADHAEYRELAADGLPGRAGRRRRPPHPRPRPLRGRALPRRRPGGAGGLTRGGPDRRLRRRRRGRHASATAASIWHLAQVREGAVLGRELHRRPRRLRRHRRADGRQLQAAELRPRLRAGRPRGRRLRRPGRGLHQRPLPALGRPRRHPQARRRLGGRRRDLPRGRVDRRPRRVRRPGDHRPVGHGRRRLGRHQGRPRLRPRRRGAGPADPLGRPGRRAPRARARSRHLGVPADRPDLHSRTTTPSRRHQQ